MKMTPEARRADRLDDAAYCSKRFDAKVKGLAKRLRELADEIEREGKVREPGPFDDNRFMHAKAASHVVHTITWGLANLNLDSLIAAAAEADHKAHVPHADEMPEVDNG